MHPLADSTADGFDSRFEALTGRPSYGLQPRLYLSLLSGETPDALDLPTGLGKTSVSTIWLLARAAGTPVQLRLIYVVYRRAVVDQASGEAEHPRKRLTSAEPEMNALWPLCLTLLELRVSAKTRLTHPNRLQDDEISQSTPL